MLYALSDLSRAVAGGASGSVRQHRLFMNRSAATRQADDPGPAKSRARPFALRAAQPADIDALERIENASFDSDRISRRSFRNFLTRGPARIIVAEIDGDIVGYALVLFRAGTALARLYSIAVTGEHAGLGIARALIARAEEIAYDCGCVFLRLEVREDNARAVRLYEDLGYRQFGRYLGYYADRVNALRYEKWLSDEDAPRPPSPAYFEQTLDFTCAPACMMMALKWAGRDIRFDLADELRLWREATTVYMTSGHGGCEPFGIAVSLARRGLSPQIHVSRMPPYFLDSVRDEEKRMVMTVAQQSFVEEARELAIPVDVGGLTQDAMTGALNDGALVMLLVSGYRMFARKVPHWLLVIGHDDTHAFVHDPWVEDEHFETRTAAANLPIPFNELDRMARYGREGLRAAIVIRRAPARPAARNARKKRKP